MNQAVWQAGPEHELTAELGGLRAVVSRVGEDGAARFVVLRPQPASGRPAPVQSGHRPTVQQAMAAAERTAERLASLR